VKKKAPAACNVPAICAAGFLLAAALGAQEGSIVAKDAWARVPLPSQNDIAVFLVLENHTGEKRTIVSVSSDAASSGEIHEMIMQRAVMKMVPVARVTVGAHGKKSFDPNDLHIMLFGLKKKPSVGDTITLTLKMDDGTSVPVTATFRKYASN